MTRINTCCTPLKPNEVVERSLDLKVRYVYARKYLKRTLIYLALTLLLVLTFGGTIYLQGAMLLCIIITSISTVTYLLKYIVYVYRSETLKGTQQQKRLLQFDDNDNSFVVQSPKTNKAQHQTDKDVPFNATILSWHSSFSEGRGFGSPNWSYNCGTASSSPGQTQQKQMQLSTNISYLQNSSLNMSNISNDSTPFTSSYYQNIQEPITDEISLQKYLLDVSRKENSITELPDINHNASNGSINSFWNYCHSAAHILKTSLYQLSPLPVAKSPSIAFCSMDSNSDVIRSISSEKLSRHVGNLRAWISVTILQRLSKEIFLIDESFKHRGFHDMRIGSIALERLKKTVENDPFVNKYMPMLPLIVTFLEMSSNQEYLVKRIKDLAEGTCISNYRWDSGSEYHGLKWDEHLPTDSAILFHIFCVYLDTQLTPLPQGSGRPFYNYYVIMGDDKRSSQDIVAMVKNRAKCAILCTNAMKPKFNFISDGEIHKSVYDRNNLFYVIIQFLIYMRTRHGSVLEGVSLGKGGINIMCVIED